LKIRVGILQAVASRSKGEALESIHKILSDSRVEADIIAMPEYLMADPTGMTAMELRELAEPLDGPWVRELSRIAVEYNSCIIASMFEESGGARPYNTVVAIGRDGGLISYYRKTHLFDALGYRESDIIMPGSEPPRVTNLCGVKAGFLVCFELRFPELFRILSLGGAQAIFIPAGWYRGDGKEEALRFLAQARAHENTVYIVVSSLYGNRFTGRSMLIDPSGIVLLDAGHGARYIEADMDLSLIDAIRSKLPVLKLRRNEIYKAGIL